MRHRQVNWNLERYAADCFVALFLALGSRNARFNDPDVQAGLLLATFLGFSLGSDGDIETDLRSRMRNVRYVAWTINVIDRSSPRASRIHLLSRDDTFDDGSQRLCHERFQVQYKPF